MYFDTTYLLVVRVVKTLIGLVEGSVLLPERIRICEESTLYSRRNLYLKPIPV